MPGDINHVEPGGDRMLSEMFGTPEPDPRLGDALRRGDASPSTTSDDELRARIVRAAWERLGRLREGPRPW